MMAATQTAADDSPFDPCRPLVYIGPSATRSDIQAILPQSIFAPPIARGDLYRARESGARIFLIIDGVFSHQLAVSPREIVDVVQDGALVLGASSMGALRAAECWPLGMQGVGLIYRLYRLGVLDSDDDVAVATNPDDQFAAVSVALVNVRYAVSKAQRSRIITRAAAAQIVEAAQTIYFADRQWPSILRKAGLSDDAERIGRFCRGINLKRENALQAAEKVARMLRARPGLADDHARRDDQPFARPERYPGHDRCVGRPEEVLKRELVTWLFGSGRYQRFIWPMIVGEPEFREIGTYESPEERASALRDRLVETLTRILEDVDAVASTLWAELDFLEELDAEVMRFHAVQEGAAAARRQQLDPSPRIARRVHEEVAIAQGVRDWNMLREQTSEGRLFGAIPLEWIERACTNLALARTYAAHLDLASRRTLSAE